ncbi:MAG: N-formylglutamate amidohydrolase [bacterium]|nr:N-formylglutamate amidohydrolase [bacterium]
MSYLMDWLLSDMEIIRYRVGESGLPVIVEALHAQPPRDDRYTGDIITGISEDHGFNAIICNVSRDLVDMNRPVGSNCPAEARRDYEKAVAEILEKCGYVDRPFLLLSVHGCLNPSDSEHSFYVGTYHGHSCIPEVQEWLMSYLTDEASGSLDIPSSEIEVSDDNPKYVGLPNLTIFPDRYGLDFSVIQLEISQTLRKKYRPQLIELLGSLGRRFSRTFF